MKRREFLTLSLASATLIIGGCGDSSSSGDSGTSSSSSSSSSNSSSSSSSPSFSSRLAIPPLLEGEDIAGVLHFDLSLQKGETTFFEGTSTNTFGVNGSFLGPTLKVKNGDAVSINYTNNLNEPTTMHGHGMHLPALMDGGVHQVIQAGETWSAQYTVKQKACTNWYHPHLMGKTADHVYKGIAGLMILEDDESESLDIPKTYGVDDIPLVLQDRFFDVNSELDYSPSNMQIMRGYIGDTFLTNGVVNAFVDVQAKEIRFRVLNGSNSTVYNLGFNDGRSFKQIATDNSFLESPISLSRVTLSPGERAEIVVDFTQSENETIYLKEFSQGKDFLKIDVKALEIAQTKTPDSLTSLDKYTIDDAVNSRSFTLSGSMRSFYINGVSMDKSIINEKIPVNQVEVWEVENQMGVNHNFHIHATHFLLVERNGSSSGVAENEKGYKDTVYIPPNESVKILVKMSDYVDASNPYMYHCHFLEHEDAGMMGQFSVI